MKVLHVSDASIPDARVERMAYLSKRRGYQTFFAGLGFGGFALDKKVFDGIYDVPWSPYARLGLEPYFSWVKRKLVKIIDSVKPDIVHAHNIFSAKVIYEIGVPFVFDDHELFSFEAKSLAEWRRKSLLGRAVALYKFYRCGLWERQVSLNAPVVTVSGSVADHYHTLGARVFVIPNYPLKYEVAKVHFSNEKEDEFTAVYVGDDISSMSRPYRDLSGLVKIFKELNIRLVVIGDKKLISEGSIVSLGYIPHMKLYEVMSHFHIGLLPWRRHWLHRYANPNKPYMYAHCGLLVVVSTSLRNVIKAFNSKCKVVKDYSELRDVLMELSNNVETVVKEGERCRELARSNFIFDKYESVLVEAYKYA